MYVYVCERERAASWNPLMDPFSRCRHRPRPVLVTRTEHDVMTPSKDEGIIDEESYKLYKRALVQTTTAMLAKPI